jgi:Amt family ammonium transporter
MGMNFAVYFLGMLGYYIAGFAFQFGGIGNVGVGNLGGLATLNNEIKIGDWGIIGGKGFFLTGDTYDVGVAVMFLFQMVFMDTTATIPTGAMAERWRWLSFVVYAFFVSIIIYPIYGNWAWGGGWLSQLGTTGPLGSGSPFGAGYIDFAGSGVVHAIGGWTALAGAIVIGPRLGKYNKDGTSNAVPGHDMVIAIAGTIILAFGWFGFNPGSTLGASGGGNLRIGMIAVDTMLAGSAGALVAMVVTWIMGKKPDIGMTCNGLLAGLVAITAPSGYVEPLGAIIIGLVAGGLVVFFVGVVDKVFKIDDPVGAISVHGVNGMWGQLAVGLFADGTAQYASVKGLFYGGGINQLLAQLVGAVVAFAWAFGISFAFFKVLGLIIGGNRPSEEMELAGLDGGEMVQPGYMNSDPLAGKWPYPPVGTPAGAAA